MNKKEIAGMAINAGLNWPPAYKLELERFAKAAYDLGKLKKKNFVFQITTV